MIRLLCGSRPLRLVEWVSRGEYSKSATLRCHLPRNFGRLHSTQQLHPKIKFDTVPRALDIEKILDSPALEQKYIESIRSSTSQHNSIHSLFVNAVDMASGGYSQDAYRFALRLWEAVFLKGFPNQALQKDLIASKLKVLHLMMNNGDYAQYERLIRPVYTYGHLGAKSSWSDTLIATFQFSKHSDRLRYSRQSISTFLKSDRPTAEKKVVLAVFLRKSLLYSDSPDAFPGILRDFIAFHDEVGDGHLLLTSTECLVYEKALRLLVTPRKQALADRIDAIARIVTEMTESTHYLSRFISSLISAVATSDPLAAIALWTYKAEKLNTNLLEFRDLADLKNVMWAYYSLRSYDRVLKVHSQNATLHDDDQIEILLRISEQTKDWKLLQKQFEDMYGHNQLPHVIHYAIVMNALASLGVVKEVEQLYEQLLKRNLQPTAEIFSALIRANNSTGNKGRANEWFAEFLRNVDELKIDKQKVAVLQAEVMEANFVDSNVDTTVAAFKDLLELQNHSDKRFVSSELIHKMLNFLASVYRQQEFEEVAQLARKFHLVNEPVYCKIITSLTQFGQFERADEVAFQAHLESRVPFSSATVTRAQLRNYRAWFKATSRRETRRFLAARATAIIRRADDHGYGPQNLEVLYVEIIKHFVSLNKLRAATSYFERTRMLNALTEEHYLPFLQHYARSETYEGYAQILDKYREMAKLKIPMSARSYLYLIKALLHMDKVNHTGFENSYKLLESVFELYGFSPVDNIAGNNVVLADLARNAPHLLKIVSEYSVATRGHLDKGMAIAVRFLSQIREKLGNNIGFDLRMSIFHEMSKVYLARGDLDTAKELLDNAIAELSEIIDVNLGEVASKLFQIRYRQLIGLKLQALGQDHNGQPYSLILAQTLHRNIRLSGIQYSEICLGALGEDSGESGLNSVLEACERYLVSGNWAEIKLRRRIQYIYKLFLVYLSRTLSLETIMDKYAVLNRYYNAVSLAELKQEFEQVKDPLAALSQQLDSFNVLSPGEQWTPSLLLRNLPQFFVPERQIPTRNTVTPTLAAALIRSVESHCNGDQNLAFQLYDRYPEIMECLLYFGEERTRLVGFRVEIDKLLPPRKSAHTEDRNSRRERAIEALNHLRITTTDIDSI